MITREPFDQQLFDVTAANISIDNLNTIKTLLAQAKSNLDDHMLEKTRGGTLRSGATWYEEGDKSSKFFINLERSKSPKKTITRLINEKGEMVTSNTWILTEEREYYEQLYKNSRTDQHTNPEHENIFKLKGPILDPDWTSSLGDPITEHEIEKIIMNSPTDKSPGTDGLTTKFYQK